MKRIFSHSSRRFSKACLLTVAAAIVVVSYSGSALAAPYTWAGVSGATWDLTNGNWTNAPTDPWNGTNGPTNVATFNQTGSNSAVVSGLVTTNGITFSPTAGGTLTLSGGTIALAGGTSAQILNVLPGGTTGLTAGSTLTIASTITSTTNFFIGGFGTTILSGSNSLSGTVTIGSGTSQVLNPEVRIANSNALNGATAVAIINGGTNSSQGQTLSLADGVTIAGKSLSAAGASRNAVLALGTAAWNGNVTGGVTFNTNATATNLLTLGTGTDTTITGANTFRGGAGTGVINSAILGASSTFGKTDQGLWIINSASNTFTTFSVSSGTVQIASIANAGVVSPMGSGTSFTVGNTSASGLSAFNNFGLLRVVSSTGG
ncbi:MAG: hypothetical protein EBR28_12825, partial [Planctomycetia bacterium]|nr:hypothetical protein [Planctomycetia bacterium]